MTDVSVIILLVVSKAMEPTSCKLYLRAPITIEPQTHMELCCSMKNNSWNPFVIIIALFYYKRAYIIKSLIVLNLNICLF